MSWNISLVNFSHLPGLSPPNVLHTLSLFTGDGAQREKQRRLWFCAGTFQKYLKYYCAISTVLVANLNTSQNELLWINSNPVQSLSCWGEETYARRHWSGDAPGGSQGHSKFLSQALWCSLMPAQMLSSNGEHAAHMSPHTQPTGLGSQRTMAELWAVLG